MAACTIGYTSVANLHNNWTMCAPRSQESTCRLVLGTVLLLKSHVERQTEKPTVAKSSFSSLPLIEGYARQLGEYRDPPELYRQARGGARL